MNAPLAANLTLVIELAMGFALIFGVGLVWRRRYRAHAICQSTVVLLNLVVIGLVMMPSFRSQVAPVIPHRLHDSYFAIATAHAAVGVIAELFGIYILLVAGTNLLPRRLRFSNYKPWMRTALALWWLALLLGLTTYARWYIAPPSTQLEQSGSWLANNASSNKMMEVRKDFP
ncbi:hypothetical protein [Pedosphaera parvula]|uniref:DUF420 domain-containing protein n=1 Tax=Pedosphaera parvula (strain Ellin514) TaxID=320771 RepID=B9XRM8_PEDPL|nr:hypothetical protein [Pedosphaera parvula]EEF57499.1 hypothetical protein Cflav_PD0430 [Pedosphaera parvula Ellin514]